MFQEHLSHPFRRDSRGNRLENWRVTNHAGGHRLWLRGTREMADQVTRVAPEYRRVLVPRSVAAHWTHALRSPSAPRDEVARLMKLLSEVITLPFMPSVAGAIALDWYKQPLDEVDPYSWPNTEVGELVHRGKYRFQFHPRLRGRFGLEITSRMCLVIENHPGLRGADVVVNVPGHDSSQVSFGSQLAATVARDTQKPFVKLKTKDPFRLAAKSAHVEQRAKAIRGQFSVPLSLDGQNALIVDDVVHSGESIREAARAALAAGANLVYGLCAVRTRRS
jgi:hypothetical protein